MSLLDWGNETVEVFPERAGTDEYGNTVVVPGDPATDIPVLVAARVQPSTAEEDAALGLALSTSYRVVSRDFPGGAPAVLRWDGRLWDVIGEPKRRNGSPQTRHVTTFIQARTPRAV